MLGSDLWHYFFVRTCILILSSIAPCSIAYSLLHAAITLPAYPPRIIQVWLVLEAMFYVAIYLPLKRHVQKAAKYPALLSRDERRKLFWRCQNSIPDPNHYMTTWFRGASEADIKRENVKDFFRWAFLNAKDPDLAHEEELEEYTSGMEKLWGREIQPGRGSAKCLRLTLDKVQMSRRSLTWYLCISIVDTIASISLMYHSFNFHRTSFGAILSVFPFRPLSVLSASSSPVRKLTYWHRPHTSKTRLPILFIHGIGVGLYPYIKFLADINAKGSEDPCDCDGQVGIIAIEIMSISSRITAEAMSKREMCDGLCRILKAHGWNKFVLVSHSYGSVIATHLLHHSWVQQQIGPIFFIDPVSFLLHLPDLAHNFIIRKPNRANELMLSYFGSKDIGTSHTLSRRFFWAENALWKEDLHNHRVGIALAGKDNVINTRVVLKYLLEVEEWEAVHNSSWTDAVWKADSLEVMWFRDLDHGQVFQNKATRDKLVRILRDFCTK